MITTFKPIGKWLSVRFRPPVVISKTGLFLVTPAYSQIATILAVGGQVKEVAPGDLVMMHKYGDAMSAQSSLWYHYLNYIIDNPEKVKDYESAPVVVEEGDGNPDDVLVHLRAQDGNQMLRFHAHEAREQKRSHRLHEDRCAHDKQQDLEEWGVMLDDYLVDEILRRPWQNESGEAVDADEEEPK